MRYLVVLLASLMLILTACGGSNTDDTENNNNGTEEKENNEETENTEGSEETTNPEELVVEKLNEYGEVMQQFQDEHVDGSTVKDMETVEDVANYFLENAPVTEKYANQITGKIVEAGDEGLTWVESDFELVPGDHEFRVYSVFDDNYLINYSIKGDATENRGHYTYNVIEKDGEWLLNEVQFGYLDGEFPKEEESEEGSE